MINRLLIVLLLLLGATASADSSQPWARGISAETRAKANRLFAEANTLFGNQAHPAAIEKYRAALALWDHPMIQFNMAITLVHMERWLEAADALDSALRFGDEPFTPALHKRALAYQRQVNENIGTVEVACWERGIDVSLDGKRWFACPGRREMRVLAGEHAVVAEGAGFVTKSWRATIHGGDEASRIVTLDKVEAPVVVAELRRWKPWIVTGVGVAAGAVGAGLWFVSYRRSEDADARFREACMLGCPGDGAETRVLYAARDRADREHAIGTGFLVAGGALVIGGIVWAVIDRPQRERPQVQIAPSREGATATVGWKF